MYWFKPQNILKAASMGGFLLLLAAAQSCRPANKQSGAKLPYFDLKEFFHEDSLRLTNLNPPVNKTVVHNGVSETKVVHIGAWSQEFNLFIQSDINKPAWKNSYLVNNSNGTIVYSAIDPELKTRQITIKKEGDKVKWMLIYNHTKNILYETDEKLSYFPDSLYIIQKSQKVRLMGRNFYKIEGHIKN